MAKFCFFTDPAKLAAQQPAQAFGAISADAFNVTDLHTAAGDAIAVAVCDGQLRVQEDTAGSLTLILKPDSQPPFDFPFISYFLYKGVERASLLDDDGAVPKQTDAAGKELVGRIHDIWQVNANPGDPDSTALGLQLAAPAADYADDQPIDRLFYEYAKEKPPVPVRAGDRLARFAAQFGLEIAVEQLGRPPTLARARQFQTIITARPPGGGAPNDAQTFLRTHDKEAILGSIDPCAFWGSFFQSKLKASALPGSQKVKGDDVYADMLVGAGGEGAASFANRNRAYLDLRDEHGHSLDYYGAVGGTFRLAGEDGAPLTHDYYDPAPPRHGWPCCWLPHGLLPTSAAGRYASFELVLPATDYSRPLPYLASGWRIDRGRKALRPPAGQDRIIDRAAEPGGVFLLPVELGAPLTGDNVPAFAASYQRINHFKRPRRDAATHPPARAADAANLAPVPLGLLDHVIPVFALPPLAGEPQIGVRTYAELVLVPWPSGDACGFVARPGFAEDGANVYLFLFPVCRWFLDGGRSRPAAAAPGPPSLQFVADFLPDFVEPAAGSLAAAALEPPTPAGPPLTVAARVGRGAVPCPDFLAVAVKRSDYEQARTPANANTHAVEGSGWLTLARSPPRSDVNGRSYVEATATYSRLTWTTAAGASGAMSRESRQSFPTLYADAVL